MNAFQKMPGDPEVDNLDTELTRLEVGVRQMVQDFPLCATFREIDQQNALVRGEIDSMREKLVRLDNLALEQVPEKKGIQLLSMHPQMDRVKGEDVKKLAEQHREQLGAVQRQFRQANVKVGNCLYSVGMI